MKTNPLLLLLILIVSCSFTSLPAQNWNEIIKAVAADRGAGDHFGASVDVSGNYAIVGSPNDPKDTLGLNPVFDAGSAYIFERDSLGIWNQVQKLVASSHWTPPATRWPDANFGNAVSIDGDYAVVGAYQEDEIPQVFTGTDYGAAFIFKRDSTGRWNEVQKLKYSLRFSRFGTSLHLHDDIILVYNNANGLSIQNDWGEARVYKRNASGSFVQGQILANPSQYDPSFNPVLGEKFGYSNSQDGNNVILGCPGDAHDASEVYSLSMLGAGSAYLYTSLGNGQLTFNQKVVASDRSGGAAFGWSASMSGDYALIGAYKDDKDTSGGNILADAGSAYLFKKNMARTWVEVQKIVASDRGANDLFGKSVSFSGDLAVVGSENKGAYVFKLNANGLLEEVKKITSSDLALTDNFGSAVSTDGETILVGAQLEDQDGTGANTLTDAGSAYFFGLSQATISGNVYADGNGDCILQSTELPLPQWIVRSTAGPFGTLTKANGDYTLGVDTGQHQLQLLPIGPLSTLVNGTNCPVTNHSVYIDSTISDTAGFDYAMDMKSCHLMTVSVSGYRRRICSPSGTVIHYANQGLDTAFNAKMYVTYSFARSLYGASLPYSVLPNGDYEFTLGDMPPLSSGTLYLQDSVTCNFSSFGHAACVKARVTPFSNCNVDPSWCGDDLRIVDGQFIPPLDVVYTFSNVGSCDMADSSDYRLLLDSTLVSMGKVKLLAGDSISIQVTTAGKTARLEVDQVPFHPVSDYLVSTVEACCLPVGSVVSKGFVLPYPQSDPGDASIDVYCGEIQGSYDPNEKLVQPTGITAQHYTKPGTELDYTIHFQNLGNDTAFLVRIVDSLSPSLDISTLRQGAGSHPYQLDISGTNPIILTFTFNPIQLVDSATNPAGSQGFVTFSITPFGTVPIGTRIENFADIYFDSNPPVRTPTAFNTLRDTTFIDLDPTVLVLCGIPTPAVAGADIFTCGDSVTLAANTPLSGAGIWQIVSGRGSLANALDPQSAVSNLGYGVTVLEWKTQLCTNISTDRITITRDSVASVSISGGQDFCSGDNTALFAPQGFATYRWSNGDTTASILITSGGTYTVYGINSKGCRSNVSAPVTITEFPSPLKPVISGLNEFCQGSSTTLSAPLGFSSYLWSFGSTSQSISINVAGTFSVTVTDSNGCSSPVSDPVVVSINLPPAKPVITGDTEICEGDTAIISVPTGFAMYTWSNGVTGNFQRVTTGGSFSVAVKDSNGCESPLSDAFTVLANPTPATPVLTQISPDSLRSSVTSGNYQWFLNGVLISLNTAGIQPTQSGTYTVVVTENGCISDTSNAVVFIVTGIERELNNSFSIYPNPNKGQFTLEVNLLNNAAAEIQLFDLTGRTVFQEKIKFKEGKKEIQVDGLIDGVYLLAIDGEVGEKIVVRKR